MIADADVLARIGGPIGDEARTAQRELAKLDEGASRAKRASWLAAARVPIPAGLRGIDASWIAAAIARVAQGDGPLGTRARRVIADGPMTAGDVWLARWLCAELPAMPVIDATITRPRSIADATRMSATALHAWLEDVGADQIAFAVGRAATAMSSRLGAAALRIAQAPRVGEMGERRAAIERARIAIDETALLRVGARTIAAYAGPSERRVIAYRLPRTVGVRGELEAFAGSAGAPSWRALAAP